MRSKSLLLALSLLGVVSCQSGSISINSAARLLQDESRRSVLFHGVNVVYKQDPYIPDAVNFDPYLSLTDQDIDDLVSWGFNFVRLGVMWEAVERTPGVFNTTYLQECEKLINRLGEKGIYTLVDAHQDVFARRMCGEGVPDFYATDDVLEHNCRGDIIPEILALVGACKPLKDYGFRYDSNGDPLIEDCQKNNFATYYMSPESVSAFDRLYSNTDGLQDKFLAYWDSVSSFFSNNQYVVGYDPINEPYPSDYFKEPLVVLEPGRFDREKLQPLYKNSFDVYQKYDKTKIMFFESAEFPDEIGLVNDFGIVYPLGFTEPPGGEEFANIQVLNDHTYCCQLRADMCAIGGEPPLSEADACLEWHEKRISTRSKDAERYGLPLIITEFGACMGSDACVQEIKSTTDVCDNHLVGWAYWEFKNFADLTTSAGTGSEGFYNADGTLQAAKVKSLARTYFPATQGVPTKINFDTASALFQGTFTVDTTIELPTIVYKSDEYYYPNGYTLSVTDLNGNALAASDFTVAESAHNYLQIQVVNSALNGQSLTITVAAKESGNFLPIQ